MRAAGWESRLDGVLLRWRDGGNGDCAAFALDAMAAMRGRAAFICGTGSWRGRAAAFRRLGARSMEAAAAALMGASFDPIRAEAGDIVIVGRAFGVVIGDRAAFLGSGRLTLLSLPAATAAWRP